MAHAAAPGTLKREELSAQEGVFYVGCYPDGDVPTLWSYAWSSKSSSGITDFYFWDCRFDLGGSDVVATRFTWRQVERLLRKV